MSPESWDQLEALKQQAAEDGRSVCRPYPLFAFIDEFFSDRPFECDQCQVAPGESLVDTLTFSLDTQSYSRWPGEVRVRSTLVYGARGAHWQELRYDQDASVEVVIPVP